MAADFYGSSTGVIVRTGVDCSDLGLDTPDDLTAELETLLTQAADLMDRQMRTSYLADDIPAGLDAIAEDVVAAAVRSMVQSRQTPVVRIDDFVVRTVTSVVLTPDIKERLALYALGRGVVTVEVAQDSLRDAPASELTTLDLESMDQDIP